MRNYLIFALASLSLSAFADSSPFQYTASIPYAGGMTINIVNTSASVQTLSSIAFTDNVTLDTSANSCWGSAVTYQSTLSGSNGSYTISNVASPVSVPANGSVTLTCTTQSVLPPLSFAMLPTNVEVNGVVAPYPVISTTDPGNGYQIVGYYTSWGIYGENFQPSMIPANKINTIAYAFEGFGADGSVFPDDSNADQIILPQLQQIKLQYPYMKVLLGFGGWQTSVNDPNSPPWSEMAANSTAEQNFVKNAVAWMEAADADGLNIDWEYPVVRERPENGNDQPIPATQDAQDYAKLISDLRQALNVAGAANGKHYLLTIAGPAGDQNITAIEAADPGVWQTVANNVDYNYLMTYDFHGQFDYSSTPSPDSPSDSAFLSAFADDPNDPYNPSNNGYGKQFNVEDAVNDLLAYFKPGQIVVGVPLYGRLESINYSSNDGLFNSLAVSDDPGEWGSATMYDYRCIIDQALCNSAHPIPSLNHVAYNADQYAMTPWAYSNNYFISYDDVNSMTYKANWIKAQHLGGAMFWDLSGDVRPNDPIDYQQNSVINAAQQVFSTTSK